MENKKNQIGKLNYIRSTNIFAMKNFINFLIAGSENAVFKSKKENFKYIFYIKNNYLNPKAKLILSKLNEFYNNQLEFIEIR